ncbi:MBL fold metallo-hydrolase RNA specificity domain-containing protein [Caballeronia cordobensis]|uniref:MBL fold metallo-hydrolase RNA specificity domain-containing protein n=1 Tax=Caballeronia cordobensis TaxID=1353886 RepID=UPI00045EE871|nr:beta-lactamase domain protein [Burkholderia sp. RPE67]BBP96318.1 MBL fold hydrolase [Burkholderia sp. SFA1]
MRLTFLGAAETVTGSKYLLEHEDKRILVDCGLFQGTKNLRLRNWASPAFEVDSLTAIILTHAHLDHSGYLPVLAQAGYRGPVYCTPGTSDLCEILLLDSAKLQEEEASFSTRHGFSRHHPALPLYTLKNAQDALRLLAPRAFDVMTELGPHAAFRLLPAGHILGAASVELRLGGQTLLFSGDIGRPCDPLMRAPQAPPRADVLVVESTYGDRLHATVDPLDEIAAVFADTFRRGGVVVIPCFAVGRAQTLLHFIASLREAGRIARVPVFLDSPMATSVTQTYVRHASEHRLTRSQLEAIEHVATIVRTVDESKAVCARKGPMVVIAGSGMATGGRVLHHLKVFAPDDRNTILLVGYQAAGTRGAALAAHAPAIKIFGEYVPVRARVASLDSMSAHADYAELLDWLRGMPEAPSHTFVTHGEPAAADALRRRIEETLHWPCSVPVYKESVQL